MMKRKRNHATVDYWDTLADAMVALFLLLLLIVLLFVLYFLQVDPENDYVDEAYGNDFESYTATEQNPVHLRDEHRFDDPEAGDDWFEEEQQSAGAGGGGGGGESGGGDRGEDDETGEKREEPEEQEVLGEFPDGVNEGEKSAVLVEVVDGETLIPLKLDGISFALYNHLNTVMTLHDYYPTPVEYKSFETNMQGSFYLPEKIHQGDYTLHALSEVDGYGPPEDTPFTVDDYYDWSNPFYVAVKMFPLRSTIRIQLVDKNSGEKVSGGSFRVIAAQNIITLDGTIRYNAGETVDTIFLNADGFGESKELYFGQYYLRQEGVPEFYGSIGEEIQTPLEELSSRVDTVETEKTAMQVTVRDALYNDLPIEGAEFVLTGGSSRTRNLVSDVSGQLLLTDLLKNTTYTLRQTATTGDYLTDKGVHTFTVDGSGLIQGKIRQEMFIGNRMIRASFVLTGILLKNRESDVRMALTDPQGNIVRQWTTTGAETTIEGLTPGDYRVVIGNDMANPVSIYISDSADVQTFSFSHWTRTDTAIVAAVAVLLLVALVIIILVERSRRQNRKRMKRTKKS